MPVDWKQILTTGDIGALHQDAGNFGHLYDVPQDISRGTYIFDGTEGFGNVLRDGQGTAMDNGLLGKVLYKNGLVWPTTSAINDTAGAKKLLGILIEPENYFLLNGIAFLPSSSFDTSSANVESGFSLYLSVFHGLLTTAPPTQAGEVIRLVGYVIDLVPEWDGSSVGVAGDGAIIFFSPSAVWLEQE